MKKSIVIIYILIASSLSNLVIAAENSSEVPRISAILAYEKYKTGKAILVDAMNPDTYSKKRALGSVNIPNDGPRDIARAREMPLPVLSRAGDHSLL